MKKFDVQIALEGIAEAKATWAKAITEFNAGVEYVMTRLIHEAAANYMSVEEVAKASGLTPKRVRLLMRNSGLDPKKGKRLLAKHAAEALAENAALLGIAPHEMDLMSPLAYLPMGKQLRQELQNRTVSQVHELEDVSGNTTHSGYQTISEAVHDLHLRGGKLRPFAICPTCSLVGEA